MRLFIIFGILIFSLQTFAQNKNVALKFDEFDYARNLSPYNSAPYSYDYRYDTEKNGYNYEKIRFDDRVVRFAQEIIKQKNSTAYIIFYNQRKGKHPLNMGEIESQDAIRILTNQPEYAFQNLNPKYKVSPERVITLDGGFRETPTLEFWIVPQNAEPPKPTPTFSPSEISICPEINVAGDGYRKNRNQPLKFSVAIKDQAPDSKLDLEWNISAGKIIKGRNTNQIEVDLSRTDAKFISASVTVKGLHPECENHKFTFTQVGLFPYKFDEFTQIPESDLSARLDGFMGFLNAELNSIGYIIIYANRTRSQKDVERMKVYINQNMKFRNFDLSRMNIVNGGFREEMMIEFYLVPQGAEPPKPTPTLDSQFVVEPKKTTKKRPKTKK